MPNKWIQHVKEYASKNNVSYKEAMSKAKATYVKDIVNTSPLKKVKIKIKKAPPLPSKLPDDISPPPLPLSKPPKLKKSVKIKVVGKRDREQILEAKIKDLAKNQAKFLNLLKTVKLQEPKKQVKKMKKIKLKRAEMYYESKNPYDILGK